jgi:gliding motility-associated-like protein
MWAQSPVVSNTNVDMGLAVTTDKNNDVYMAGIFTDTIQFGTYQFISSPGLQALFIVKYDASGNVLWAQSPNGTVNYQQSTNRNELSLAADKADHIYLTGSYSSSTITFGPHTLTNIGSDNIYMVKFDMAGNTIWARSAGGQIQDAPNKIAIDRTNNVYITGTFTSPTCSFGPHVLTTTNSTEFFIAKYDTGGNALWAKASKSPTRGYSVAIDSCNNILASGACDSVVSIDSLTYTVSVGGFDESFYLKFDSTGKVLNGFVFESGGDDQDDLTSDKFGDIIMGGDFAVAVTMGTTTIPKGCSETADIIKFQLGEKCCRQSSNETVCCSSTINPGQSVNLDVNPAGGSNTYSWYPATGVSCDTCPSITVTPSVTTTYYVCTITNGGKDCENEEVTITVDNGCQDFTVPNVFTPNNDEQNDEFTINALGMDSYTIDIYDRWGIKEFHANNASISWDGHNPSGNQVTDGVYYYIIKATCQGKPFDKKGFVQVIR